MTLFALLFSGNEAWQYKMMYEVCKEEHCGPAAAKAENACLRLATQVSGEQCLE